MPERNLYEVLMLHPTATIEVINAAYRTLAKQYHPDHAGPEGAEKMAQINEAFAILSNEEKRARYDEITRQVQGRPTRGSSSTVDARCHEPEVRRRLLGGPAQGGTHACIGLLR